MANWLRFGSILKMHDTVIKFIIYCVYSEFLQLSDLALNTFTTLSDVLRLLLMNQIVILLCQSSEVLMDNL